uniref:Uncharacterized protein n=1 Tax=Arcella intermedia TaxID=1963864 RepID=A0A6B2LN33_9EUKA
MLGSGGVGKATLFTRYIYRVFIEKFDPTIEEGYRKYIEINGKQYSLEILYTHGETEYTAMRDVYIHNSEGCILVYSITDKSTFNVLQEIHSEIVRIKECHPPLIIVGNKVDLEESRAVSKESGEALAAELSGVFMETSAKTPTNVIELFEAVQN